MLNQVCSTLEVPPAPPGAPEYLERLLARLQAMTEAEAWRAAREGLRDTIGFLTRYFGVVLAASAERLGEPRHPGQGLGGTREAEEVMHTTLAKLLRTTDPMAVALRSVFFREQLSGEFLPFPHTRLLLRDGWLASGAQTLTEWLTSSCEPESDDSCREELDLLLPVLSQWLAASSPFFLECRYDYLISPRQAFEAVGLRGLEGGRRVSMQRVELVTRFRDVRSELPLRTRDLETEVPGPDAPVTRPAQIAPAPSTEPLAELVRQLLESPPSRPTSTSLQDPPSALAPEPAPPPLQVVTESPERRRDEFDFFLSAAPVAAASVLLYLFLLAI